MHISIRSGLLSVFGVLLALSLLSSKPTEASLLTAWEAMQRDDPETVVFKKVEDGVYEFKTDHFPYEGLLTVLNVTIDERMAAYDYGATVGVIEVELPDLPEDFREKYSYSYDVWASNNILYYESDSEQWLTSADFFSRAQVEPPLSQPFFVNYGTTCLLIIVFIIILIVFFLAVSRLQKRNKEYLEESRSSIKRSLEIAEKSLTMTEESNKILREMLEELKRKNK